MLYSNEPNNSFYKEDLSHSSVPLRADNDTDVNELRQDSVKKEARRSHRKNGLEIVSLNVNDLLSRIDEVRVLAKNENIDILAINESKIDDNVIDQLIDIDEFDVKRFDRDRHGGGVALYIRNTVTFKARDNLPNETLELICIEIEPPNASPFIIVAWYRPPSLLISCFNSLEENLRFLDRESKEIIILGDTNCDFSLPRPSVANHSSHLHEIYDLFGLKQLIKEPTRITLHSSSLIDHIATSEYRNIVESGVIKTSLSDHFLIYCSRKFRGGVKRQHKYITSRQPINFDRTSFLSDLSEVN